jgi:hypothetical protein
MSNDRLKLTRTVLLLTFWLVVNGLGLQWLLSLGISQRVYMRDLLFSEILMDHGLKGEDEINQRLSTNFKKDASTQAYVDYLHPEALRSLSTHKGDDRSLALAIAEVLGTPDGSVCSLETLGQTVFDTRRGKGCCSDYSKSFLFYANFLGLQAREVSLFNHTTVEYLNRANGRWQWLDPFNRVEITDAAGHALSSYQIRQTSAFVALTYKKLASAAGAFDADTYAGYAPAQMSTMLWRLGTNFLEIEAWDLKMRGWGFSKSVRQAIMLSAGVQPGWLMVTTNAGSFYYKTLRALLWAAGALWVLFNLFGLAWLVRRLRLTYAAQTD